MAEILSKILSQSSCLGRSCEALNSEERIKGDCDFYNARRGHLNDEDGVECEKCLNRGDIMIPMQIGGQWYQGLKPCVCKGTRNTIRRFNRCGISKSLLDSYTFDSFQAVEPWQVQMRTAAEAFASDPNARLYFVGGATGCGKSHICTALAAHFIRAGREARYVRWREDSMRLKSIVMDTEAYAAAMWELKAVDVLYIDDFFKPVRGRDGAIQPPSEADIGLAYELIDYRYSTHTGVTILSSERYITEIVGIDEATGGRIAEMATPAYVVNIGRNAQRNYRLRGMEII